MSQVKGEKHEKTPPKNTKLKINVRYEVIEVLKWNFDETDN